MPVPDEALRQALLHHKAGRLEQAEAGYRELLGRQPAHPQASYSLGLLLFHRGEVESALQCVRSGLTSAQSSGRMWNTLGSMLMAAGRKEEATEAYRRCTEVEPSLTEGWYNLGICLQRAGRYDVAVDCLREALSRASPFPGAYEALAMLLYELGRTKEAAQVSALWLSREPSNPKAFHVAASMSEGGAPARASDAYVREHFDAAAAGFDENLRQLEYRAPQLVSAALQKSAGRLTLTHVMDAGCGTGLCGPLIRAAVGKLAGVDLSPRMIEVARRRRVYDQLYVGELCAFLRTRLGTFDAVISADTLVYFGALGEAFDAVRDALRTPGIFVFTLEALGSADRADHRLQFHGRYAHGERYVRETLKATGFVLEALSRDTLRQERGEPVAGFVVTARLAVR